jgi:DMSO/TMAO reductase YedYZ molybdopterin-dependent catalytic subunit
VAGVLAAAVAIGVAQVAAGLTVPEASPVVAVGQAAIDLTPAPVKNFAISAFGTADKTVLLGGILVVLALYAALVGILAVRRLALGMWGLALFAFIGLVAALTRPDSTAEYIVPTLAGAAAGAFALTRLARAAARLGEPRSAVRPPAPPPPPAPETLAPPDLPAPPASAGSSFTYLPNPDDPDPRRTARRRFLVGSGVAAVVAVAGTVAGRELATRRDVTLARAKLRFPRPAVAAPPLPAGSDLRIPGLSSFITPNDSFYRVDTALLLPQVDPSSWQLRIHGMVNREITITFDELLRRPLIEDYITLCCVSNPVSGPYISNALWLGTSLASLLRKAGIKAGADQLLCTSADGFTSGTPVQTVMDGRDALLAVAMNGQPLPVAHGFPARMVTPGLYGYVSATKWVTDINVTTFAGNYAYWAQRGWSQQAPIKTECRIDVPTGMNDMKPGPITVAGVAWAQHKGIEAVEVRVDYGPWHEARLAAVPGLDTWRQWAWDWDATSGGRVLQARATDKTGYTQTATMAPPEPNGATGYPQVSVPVR